jgi:hypothetical protein
VFSNGFKAGLQQRSGNGKAHIAHAKTRKFDACFEISVKYLS